MSDYLNVLNSTLEKVNKDCEIVDFNINKLNDEGLGYKDLSKALNEMRKKAEKARLLPFLKTALIITAIPAVILLCAAIIEIPLLLVGSSFSVVKLLPEVNEVYVQINFLAAFLFYKWYGVSKKRAEEKANHLWFQQYAPELKKISEWAKANEYGLKSNSLASNVLGCENLIKKIPKEMLPPATETTILYAKMTLDNYKNQIAELKQFCKNDKNGTIILPGALVDTQFR